MSGLHPQRFFFFFITEDSYFTSLGGSLGHQYFLRAAWAILMGRVENHCDNIKLRTFLQTKDPGVARKVMELSLDPTQGMES